MQKSAHVAFWHKADNPLAATNVRFRSIQRAGKIASHTILGGLHIHYVRF
jgi:hypothetical protein